MSLEKIFDTPYNAILVDNFTSYNMQEHHNVYLDETPADEVTVGQTATKLTVALLRNVNTTLIESPGIELSKVKTHCIPDVPEDTKMTELPSLTVLVRPIANDRDKTIKQMVNAKWPRPPGRSQSSKYDDNPKDNMDELKELIKDLQSASKDQKALLSQYIVELNGEKKARETLEKLVKKQQNDLEEGKMEMESLRTEGKVERETLEKLVKKQQNDLEEGKKAQGLSRTQLKEVESRLKKTELKLEKTDMKLEKTELKLQEVRTELQGQIAEVARLTTYNCQITAELTPIQIRVLLDQGRDKLGADFGVRSWEGFKNDPNLWNKSSAQIAKELQAKTGILYPPSEDVVNFIIQDSKFRDEGNAAAHTATEEAIAHAVLATSGNLDRSLLKQTYEYVFKTNLTLTSS